MVAINTNDVHILAAPNGSALIEFKKTEETLHMYEGMAEYLLEDNRFKHCENSDDLEKYLNDICMVIYFIYTECGDTVELHGSIQLGLNDLECPEIIYEMCRTANNKCDVFMAYGQECLKNIKHIASELEGTPADRRLFLSKIEAHLWPDTIYKEVH